MFPNKQQLVNEYNINFLDADGLKPYVQLGNLTQADYNEIVSHPQSNPIF